jgi:hypothetical protein
MKVFRIEDSNGIGPYSKGWGCLDKMFQSHSGLSHPSPFEEDLNVYEVDENGDESIERPHFCGFPTLDQMKVWFKGFRASLKKAGFKLSIYEVGHKDVQIGEKQLLFRRDAATLIQQLEIP